ncbi:hypothetical protein I2I11_17885 [Pontibacter sp. 172403-2]|uniref:hypothetical protein n=1 Tax=Pontibacter rufus TaxID=2791028 RepID=UPI0018AFE35C|nr:hypothetical protein [Pontibacter sp. 172403-2]MBF9255174.1 hypothetical protein [Pontibacter sp. 172403-2]
MNDNKNNNKERLQQQSEERISSDMKNQSQQGMHLDPAKKTLQQDDSKVQNPNRNLAKGGNNMPYDKK